MREYIGDRESHQMTDPYHGEALNFPVYVTTDGGHKLKTICKCPQEAFAMRIAKALALLEKVEKLNRENSNVGNSV